MSRKHLRSGRNQSVTPQPAQLNAVRKLSYAGRHEEALSRLAQLRSRHPDYKPLLALAWEVDDNAGNILAACLDAFDWSSASPHSLAAHEALYESALEAGMPALAMSAAQRHAQAAGEPVPHIPSMPGGLAELTFDQAVAADLSRLFLSFERFDDAVTALEGIDHPSTQNNLALARFAKGDIALALTGIEANWCRDKRNLFALYHLVRLRLWTGGRGFACELLDALRDTQPTRMEDAYGKMFGLLLLGAYDEAIDAWRTLRDASFWSEEITREQSSCAYFAGLATLRKGDLEGARELMSEALDLYPDNLNAASAFTALTLGALGAEIDIQVGEFHDWFPQSWVIKLQSIKGARAREAALEAQQRHCDAHEDYLATAAELGGEGVRIYAISVLKLRALDGSAAARDTLRGLLTRPCGPDDVRMDLNAWLKENEIVEPDQTQPMLLHGETKEIKLLSARLHAEPKDLGLSAASQARLEKMHRLLKQDDLHGALHIAEALAARYPDHPTMIANVANIKDALGYDADEIETLFRRSATLDPTYLFAQVGLARLAARQGKIEHARELIAPLLGRQEYHFSEWRAVLAAVLEIAEAVQDAVLVRKLNKALVDLEKQFG